MKNYFFNHSRKRKYIFAIVDAIIIAIAIFISYSLRVYFNSNHFSFDSVFGKIKPVHALVIPVHMATLYILNLYSFKMTENPIKSSISIILSIIFAGVLISGVFFFFPKYVFGRQVLLTHIVILSFLLVFWRVTALRIMGIIDKEKRIALICSPNIADMFANEISKPNVKNFKISHILFTDGQNECGQENLSPENKIFCSSLSELLTDNQFDILGFDSSHYAFSNKEIQLILETRQKGKGVYDIPNLYKNLTGKVPLDYIDGRWLLDRESLQGVVSKSYLHLKRLFDVIGSLFLLFLFVPIFIIITIVIKIESKGRIVFSQERLGLNRKPFICYKFRTMVENAEALSGPVWAEAQDPRITKIGRILRNLRLDELPQLWNILKGDISFVGPRPIRKHFADILSKKIPFYELRFSVQPGLSGWAQVSYDYAGSEDGQLEKFQYELFYIQNMSLLLDIITVAKTVKSVFKGEGK